LFGVPQKFLLHKVVRDAKKVEKHCLSECNVFASIRKFFTGRLI